MLAGAHRELLGALARAFRYLEDPRSRERLGPLKPGATLTQGARVPGTSYELDPAAAAFNLGKMMGATGLAAILPVADFLARKAHNDAQPPLVMRDVLQGLIEARVSGAAGVVARLLGEGRDVLAAGEAAVQAVLAGSGAISAGLATGGGCAQDATPWEEFDASVRALFPVKQAALIRSRTADVATLSATPVHEFIALLVRNA